VIAYIVWQVLELLAAADPAHECNELYQQPTLLAAGQQFLQ
jgi:hypothetical protein